jgi:hypothetical protein
VEINPEDKRRFGEDSTPILEDNARAAARRFGVRLVLGEREVRLGDLEAAFDGGEISAGRLRAPAGEAEWRAFKALLLSFFINYKRAPGEAELRELLFAATGSEKIFTKDE